jgi:ElaB/YqjD/DUF883 family membrane-anchored ribosome-binding protein
MLSEKAKAAVDKIRTLDADDLKALSDAIKAEVDHAAEKVVNAAKATEVKARKLAGEAEERAERAYSQTRQQIEDNPIPATLIALGAGFLLGCLISGSRDD